MVKKGIKEHLSSIASSATSKLKKTFLVTATAATLFGSLQSCKTKNDISGKGNQQEQISSDSSSQKFQSLYKEFARKYDITKVVERDGLYILEKGLDYTVFVVNGPNLVSMRVIKVHNDGTLGFNHVLAMGVLENHHSNSKEALSTNEKISGYNELIQAIEKHNIAHQK